MQHGWQMLIFLNVSVQLLGKWIRYQFVTEQDKKQMIDVLMRQYKQLEETVLWLGNI